MVKWNRSKSDSVWMGTRYQIEWVASKWVWMWVLSSDKMSKRLTQYHLYFNNQ